MQAKLMMVMGKELDNICFHGCLNQHFFHQNTQHRNFGADSLSEPKIVSGDSMPIINPTMPRLPVKNESPNLSPRLGPEPELGVGSPGKCSF